MALPPILPPGGLPYHPAPPPAAQGGTGGPPILPPGGLPSPAPPTPPAAQGGTGGPPILPPGGLGGGPSGPSPAQQQAAAQRQQIVNSLIHQASSWGASNGIPFALQAQLLAGAASKYQIPLNAMLGIYGQETSFGQNVTYSGVGPGQGATGPFQFESFNFGKYGYPGTNKPTPSQFAQQVDAFGKYLVANNSSKDPNGYAPAMGGGYSQQQANSTLSGIPHGLAAAVSAVTGGKIPAVDPAKAAAALRTAAANAPPALVPGSLGGAQTTSSGRPRRFYVNPFASAQGLSPERIDMGVDYAAKAGSPIGAIGAAKILSAAPGGTGWTSPTNTQAGVVYQLLQGPMKGKDVYVTEDITPTVKAGDVVPAGGQIAKFLPSGTGIETGWATGQGFGSLAASLNQQAQGGDPGGHASASGANFSNLLAALGAPAGVGNGAPNGTMPPGYFQSGAAGASGAPLPSSSFSASGGAPSSGGAAVAPSGGSPSPAPSGDSSGAQAQAQTQQQALLAQLMGQGQGPQSTLQSLLASSPGNLWNTVPSGGGVDAFAGLSGGDMAGLLGLAQTSLQSLVPNMKLRGLGAIPLP